MKKKIGSPLIVAMFAFFLAVVLFGVANGPADAIPPPKDTRTIVLKDAVLVEGEAETPVTLPLYVDMDGEVTLRLELDYRFAGHTAPTLILQANHTFMTFVLDGEELHRVVPTDHSLGNYFAKIPLPGECRGSVLEIRISVPEKGLQRIQVPEIVLADEGQYMRDMLHGDIPSLVLNTMILFCGVLMLLLALLDRKRVDASHMLLGGMLALNCALYFMCETMSVVYLAGMPRLVYYLDMVSVSLLAPPLLILFGEEVTDWRRKLLRGVAALGVVNTAAQLVLAMTGVMELRRMLIMTHGVQIASIFAMLACLIAGAVKREKRSSSVTAALLVAGGALDILLFMLEMNRDNVFFLKIALVIYFCQQMIAFVRRLMEQSAQRAREVYYKALALQDPMTRCYSRAAFEIDKQEWGGGAVRTAFFLDLNNLKAVNDRYGHREGDRLIRAFGDILSQVFEGVGKCYRVGGDEFWVFCDALSPGKAREMVGEARQTAEAYNKKNSGAAPLRYAVGVADTDETKGDLEETLRLADVRMYEDKRAEKAAE